MMGLRLVTVKFWLRLELKSRSGLYFDSIGHTILIVRVKVKVQESAQEQVRQLLSLLEVSKDKTDADSCH